MKKLYNKKGKVHPSPPPLSSSSSSINPDPFALLPATILALIASLSVQDREVLAYLISYTTTTTTTTNNNNNSANVYSKDHNKKAHEAAPMSHCDCFGCYTSFWARWDASPNRQLIHEIIEAYEEKLAEKKKKNPKVKKGRKNKMEDESKKGDVGNSPAMKEEPKSEVVTRSCDGDEEGAGCCEMETEKASSVRRLVSFIGDKIWGVWN